MKFRIPYLLVALSLIPVVGGAVRLLSLGAEAVPSPADARFIQAPLPVVVHILCAVAYSVVGAFQFDEDLRRAQPVWPRRAGWVLWACGVLSALSGVWMTLAYDIPTPLQGPLLAGVRVLVGLAMATSLLLAIVAISKGNVRSHRAWMVRAYALGQGAGTQVVLLLPPALWLGGHVTGLPRDLLMTAAWAINVVIAELMIRRWVGVSSSASQPVTAAAFPVRAGQTL
jgi:uncharacterized membrane protein